MTAQAHAERVMKRLLEAEVDRVVAVSASNGEDVEFWTGLVLHIVDELPPGTKTRIVQYVIDALVGEVEP